MLDIVLIYSRELAFALRLDPTVIESLDLNRVALAILWLGEAVILRRNRYEVFIQLLPFLHRVGITIVLVDVLPDSFDRAVSALLITYYGDLPFLPFHGLPIFVQLYEAVPEVRGLDEELAVLISRLDSFYTLNAR